MAKALTDPKKSVLRCTFDNKWENLYWKLKQIEFQTRPALLVAIYFESPGGTLELGAAQLAAIRADTQLQHLTK